MTSGSVSRKGSAIDPSTDEATSNVLRGAKPAIEAIDLTFLRHLGIPAAVLDRQRRVAAINKATEAVTGLSQGRLRDQDFVELLPEDRRVPSQAEFTRV